MLFGTTPRWANAPKLQFKLHKPVHDVDARDLVHVCATWGFGVEIPVLAPLS